MVKTQALRTFHQAQRVANIYEYFVLSPHAFSACHLFIILFYVIQRLLKKQNTEEKKTALTMYEQDKMHPEQKRNITRTFSLIVHHSIENFEELKDMCALRFLKLFFARKIEETSKL